MRSLAVSSHAARVMTGLGGGAAEEATGAGAAGRAEAEEVCQRQEQELVAWKLGRSFSSPWVLIYC